MERRGHRARISKPSQSATSSVPGGTEMTWSAVWSPINDAPMEAEVFVDNRGGAYGYDRRGVSRRRRPDGSRMLHCNTLRTRFPVDDAKLLRDKSRADHEMDAAQRDHGAPVDAADDQEHGCLCGQPGKLSYAPGRAGGT